ncbi:MAG: PAS domain S-box protein, partial [bacterium]
MTDIHKTKDELIKELESLRARVQDLEGVEGDGRRLEEVYQSLVGDLPQSMAIFQDGRVVLANKAFAALVGYTVEDVLNMDPADVEAFVHPDDRLFVWGYYRDRLDGKYPPQNYTFRGVRKDGTVMWLEMFANRIEYLGRPATQGTCIDITKRKRAEEALGRS